MRNATPKLNANRDTDFTDATDFLITDVRLIGTTITNSGVIVGGGDYIIEEVSTDQTLGVFDEGFPTLIDSNGNTVFFDEDGVPYYELEEPVEIATMGDQIDSYYNDEGLLMAGAPADWEPSRDAEDFVIGYEALNGVYASVVDGLPLAYADEFAENLIQYLEGDINAPFYTTLQSTFYYENPTAEEFETLDGETVNLVFRDNEYVLISNVTTIEARQVAIDGSMLRDVITNAAAGIISGDVATADGSDSFTNAGQLIGTAEMGDGNDTFTNAATGKVFAARGDFGRFDSVELGRGNDTATIAGQVYGGVDLGEGNDTISVSGNIFGNLDAESGADSVTIAATGFVSGSVFLRDGNNVLTNSGTIGRSSSLDSEDAVVSVIGLVGNDFVTNTATGTIDYGIDLGGGADIIINSGRIFNDFRDFIAVDTGLGNDTLTNSGIIGSEFPIFSDDRLSTTNIFADLNDVFEVSLAVDMGGGDDLLTNFAGRVQGNIFGIVSMGAGNDTVRGGANSEFVLDDAGADEYRLGAGADAFIVDIPDNSVDVFDGGTGLNLIAFPLLEGEGPSDPPSDVEPLGHRIDLGAGRITYAIDSFNDMISNGSFAVDSIINVQQVVGSDGSDVILGGALAETLDGGEGDDTISGGGGRDSLYGDDGADVFLFASAADSGRTRATRDVIVDFEQGEDKIALTMDSNTRTNAPNLQDNWEFTDMNVAFIQFNGINAQVRAYWAGKSTIVEVDTNGDRRADFSIELQGRLNLTEDDFVFGQSAFNNLI